jgi:adenylate kinase
MARGRAGSDAILLGMLEDRFSRPDTRNGFILDGYPRNLAAGRRAGRAARPLTQPFDYAVQLECPTDLLVERIAGRAKAEGRADDSPDAVRKRLQVYDASTAPVIDYYRQQGS